MYCGNCGHKLAADALFCGNCGHRQRAAGAETAATAEADQTVAPSRPKPPMSRRNRLLVAGGATVAVLAIAYVVARAMHGPATTNAFQTAFTKALHDKSSTELKHLIDPTQKDILNSKVLDAFTASLNPAVVTDYEDRMQSAVEAQTESTKADASTSQVKPLQLIKKSSWLGDRWYIHLPVAHLHNIGIDGEKVTFAIGKESFSGADSGPLIPSMYDVKVTAANAYGSETGTESEDLRDQGKSIGLDPVDAMQHVLRITMPVITPDATVTLNGKVVSAKNGQAVIAPPPARGKLQVSAKVGGVIVTGEQDMQGGQDTVDASKVLNAGIAKAAMDAIFTFDTTWTRAYNDRNPSEIQRVDPSSTFYGFVMYGQALQFQTGQLTFNKLVVDPDTVAIDTDGSIKINDSEFYTDETGQEEEADWVYTLRGKSDGSGWWIEDGRFGQQSIVDSPDAISKTP